MRRQLVVLGILAGILVSAAATRSAAQVRRTTIDAATVSALQKALDEERKAQYAYQVIIAQYGAVVPFSNILSAETVHVQAITNLMVRYSVPVPPNTWGTVPNVIDTPPTLVDAYLAAIAIEKEDIALYDGLLRTVTLRDVVNVFTNLKAASYNHLAALNRAASR